MPEEIIEVPKSALSSNDAPTLYIMCFRNKMSPFNFKGFLHTGDLRSARNRAFKHGDRMGYKNIWVMPLVSDLDVEETAQSYSGESFLGNSTLKDI